MAGALSTIAAAVGVGAQNAPPASGQAPGHASAFDAINAAIANPANPSAAPATAQEAPRGVLNLLDPSVFDMSKLPSPGETQAPQQKPQEDDVNQQDFVKNNLAQAQAAGKQLGVDPAVLLAQSGLETGWGNHVAQNDDGTSSNNFFNIKADTGWKGSNTGPVTTHEDNGGHHVEKDAFRAYPNSAASFTDYVSFLKANPRYKAALANAHDPLQYAQELQKAGYATDPQYASKIVATMHSIHKIIQQ